MFEEGGMLSDMFNEMFGNDKFRGYVAAPPRPRSEILSYQKQKL